MTLQNCEKLYKELSEKNKCNYELVWSKRIGNFSRAGCCNYRKKIIILQPIFVELNNEQDIINLILHEISHALMPKHHHNKFWKRKCIEIGGDGKTHYGEHIKKLSTV